MFRFQKLLTGSVLALALIFGPAALGQTTTQAAAQVYSRPDAPAEPSSVRRVVSAGDDRRILMTLRTLFSFEPALDPGSIHVMVTGGVVTLAGEVPTVVERNLAHKLALDRPGVQKVINRLEIVSPAGWPDWRIEDAVRAALYSDPMFSRYPINVAAREGVVTLRGSVASRRDVTRASEIVSEVPGVEELVNRIERGHPGFAYYFDPYSRTVYRYIKPDARIKEDVESKLFWNPFVRGENIEVIVRNGTVTLTGTVSNWRERELAAENAMEAGALTVRNKLIVDQKKREKKKKGAVIDLLTYSDEK